MYKNIENYSKVVTVDEIKENEYNLHIPLYIDRITKKNSAALDTILSDVELEISNVIKAKKKFKDLFIRFLS